MQLTQIHPLRLLYLTFLSLLERHSQPERHFDWRLRPKGPEVALLQRRRGKGEFVRRLKRARSTHADKLECVVFEFGNDGDPAVFGLQTKQAKRRERSRLSNPTTWRGNN